MNMLDSRLSPIIGQLEEYASKHPNERITVHVPHDTELSVLDLILGREYVASIILTQRNDQLSGKYPGRIGWQDFAAGDYLEPNSLGACLWVLNSNCPLGLKTTLSLVSRGVRHFVFATALFTKPVRVSVPNELIRCCGEKLRNDLRYSRKAGALGARIESGVSEYRWHLQLRALLSAMRASTDQEDTAGRTGILLVTQNLGAGGSERQLVNTALGLSKRTDEDITILCLSPNSENDEHFHRWRIAESSIQVAHVPALPLQPLPTQIDESLAQLWRSVGPSDGIIERMTGLTAEFRRRRPRVVHAWLDATNIAAGFAAALTGVPHIVLGMRSVSPVHWAFQQPYMRPGYRLLSRLDNVRMLNNSDAGATDYSQWLKVDRRLIATIRNGIDVDDIAKITAENAQSYREKLGVPEGCPIVGGVFRFSEEKRPMLWAQIAAVVARKRPDVRFLIVGDGPMRSDVAEFARRESFSDRLFMPGNEPNAALPMALMTCLLLTSRMEGSPNVILEAHAAGIPVVTNSEGGTSETTMNGRCGWVVSGNDPESYAERILAVLSDPEWRSSAELHAREFVSQRFGLDRMISETLAVYQSRPSIRHQLPF